MIVRVTLVQGTALILIIGRTGAGGWGHLSNIGAILIIAVMIWHTMMILGRLRGSLSTNLVITLHFYVAVCILLIISASHRDPGGQRAG